MPRKPKSEKPPVEVLAPIAAEMTVLIDEGPVAIEVPRDREGTFEPQLIGKHERRFTGFDDTSRCTRAG